MVLDFRTKTNDGPERRAFLTKEGNMEQKQNLKKEQETKYQAEDREVSEKPKPVRELQTAKQSWHHWQEQMNKQNETIASIKSKIGGLLDELGYHQRFLSSSIHNRDYFKKKFEGLSRQFIDNQIEK